MGFFKDFKRDFAQAVNELVPDKEGVQDGYDDEDMVNTFDETDDIEIAPEDLLEDLDDVSNNASDDASEGNQEDINEDISINMESFSDALNVESDEEAKEKDAVNIPEAEIIPEEISGGIPIDDGDELIAVEALDEADMLDNIEDATSVEASGDKPLDEIEDVTAENDDETEKNATNNWEEVDINKAALDAIKREENFADKDNPDGQNQMSEKMEAVDAMNNVDTINSESGEIMTEEITYITKGTTVKGDIETDGGIDIIGDVIGNVSCGNKLILGGTIKGDVNAKELYANAAKIEGDILIEGNAKIGVGSVVVGNVVATSAVVAGAVNGDIDVQGPVIVDSTAVIMGNIKSRSVQINNGAVIEGFCSQCYSEIDVKSFFE